MGTDEGARPGRPSDEMTPERFREAVDELTVLVGERIPMAFGVAIEWKPIGTALLGRMLGTLQSMAVLLEAGQYADCQVLLRQIYEHSLVFCWLGISPKQHLAEWGDNANVQRLRMHRDALDFGHQVLSDEEVELYGGIDRPRPLQQLADRVDAYWPSRIDAFRAQPASGPKQILTFRGMYLGLYRIASRFAHSEVETLDPYLQVTNSQMLVHWERAGPIGYAALAIPLYGFSLLVFHDHFGWPDTATVREINDTLMFADEPD